MDRAPESPARPGSDNPANGEQPEVGGTVPALDVEDHAAARSPAAAEAAPAATADAQPPVADAPPALAADDVQLAVRAPRVLVVEDSRTILHLVATILGQHGYEPVLARDGQEGIERLADSQPIDLVLLDFVMPRMNGYQFCRAVRADAAIAHTPVVLMSARTEAIGDRFVEQTGALDAIGKPFDARALIAVVGQVLLRVSEGRVGRAAPEPDSMIDEDELAEVPDSIAPASRHFRQLGAVGQLVAEAIIPALRRMPPHQIVEQEPLANAVALSLSDKTLAELAKSLQSIGVHHDPDNILEGDLAGIAIAELLQFLQLQGQTCVLHVSHKKKSMSVYIRDGMVDLVQSFGTDEDFRLGRYFVRQGVLSPEEIDSIVTEGQGTLLGQLLLDQWKVTPIQLKDALVEQSSELTYELVRWTAGRFTVRKEPFSEAATHAKLGLGMSNLVLEGFRRVDEWRVMEKSIDFEAVLVADRIAIDTVDAEQLGKNEMRLLELMDGKRTVRQIMAESAMASFDSIQTVYRLVQSRLARPKREEPKREEPKREEPKREEPSQEEEPG